MAMRFFDNVKDVKELKKEYISLLKKWHPDNFTESAAIAKAVKVAQEINSQYAHKLSELQKYTQSADYTQEQKKQEYHYWKYEESFRKVVDILAHCSFISEIELCGCFLWLTVKPEKGIGSKLQSLFPDFHVQYASKKKKFYICLNPDYRKSSFVEMDMQHIRDMYGSQKFSSTKKHPDEERLLQAQ